VKPNVLHIITHDTGKYLECYGASVKTPNINKLAQKSTIFTNYFCCAPQCSPSRAGMFSSLVPHRNGMMGLAHRGFELKKGIPYLPEILCKSGYHTTLIGIQHEAEWGKHAELGYQEFFTSKTTSCVDLGEVLCDILENKPKEPFFISMGVSETHQRYPVVEHVDETLKVPDFLPDSIEVKKDIAGLNILVQRVDEMIGKIVTTVEKTKLIDNTLIIFTTDHGIAMPGAKATLFDPGIEIFMMMKGPGLPEGKSINCLSWNIDLLPTILDYLEIEIPTDIDGVSLMPAIRGEKASVRECIYPELTYHAGYDPMRSIRTEKYKYIRCFETRPYYFPVNVDESFSKTLFKKLGYFDRIRPFEFFFDLENDKRERKNLIGEPACKDVIEKFRKQLVDFMKQTMDPLICGPVPLPEGAKLSVPWGHDPKEVWNEQF